MNVLSTEMGWSDLDVIIDLGRDVTTDLGRGWVVSGVFFVNDQIHKGEETPMTLQEELIKSKLMLPELAASLRNIGEACRR